MAVLNRSYPMQKTFDTFLDAAKEIDPCQTKVILGIEGGTVTTLVDISTPEDAVSLVVILNKLSAQLSEDLYDFIHEFDEPEPQLDDSREPNELVH
jgi:hypothetical protein